MKLFQITYKIVSSNIQNLMLIFDFSFVLSVIYIISSKKFDKYVGIKYTICIDVLYRHIELENIIMSEVNEIVLANNIEIDEEIYDITEIIKEETHKNIIRMEMNTIEFPLFTKNKKIKENVGMKYIFNKENDQYLEVKPVINEKIPS